MPLVPFSDYRPDIVDLNTNASENISGCIPRGDGYGPINALQGFTKSLPSACRGYFYARQNDGSIAVFAGTATKLYLLSNIDFSWTDVSLGGSSYSSLSAGANWTFAQFNRLVFACQANAPLQVYTLGSSTAFGNNGGSPPQAAYVTIVGRFVMLSGLLSNPNRVQWSGLNDTTTWDNVTNQSNFQDLPDGGATRGVAGGDQYGIIFQDARVRTITYAPGSPVIFDILAFPSVDGLFAPQSIINANNGTYFCSPQGFKFIAPGGVPTPIGREKVDRTFFADVDTGNLQLMFGATDPASTRIFWAYKSVAGLAGQFDKMLCYDWALDKFTIVPSIGQALYSLAKPGITLESLDAIAPGIITISGATNNGSGLIRLTISGTSAGTPPGNTDLNVENSVEVYGVNGTTEANGNWAFHIINSTHIDLLNSVFTNAYTSGGAIGGSLDQLPFSLDSIAGATFAQLSAFDSAGSLGFFNGATIEANMETPEQDGQGRRMFISALRPITDASAVLCSVAARDNAQSTSVYTTETALSVDARCPQRIETRYARAKVRIPAGSSWTFAMGVEPDFKLTGTR